MSLPLPDDPVAIEHSQRLTQYINAQMQQADGAIPFRTFMESALYAPNLGYYSAGLRKFGKGGDFVTAPELSPLFSRCIAKQCQAVLATLTNGVIIEFGAGTGAMAAEILRSLAQWQCLPARYYIMELSASLQQVQQQTLQTQVPDLYPYVEWLTHLPEQRLQGVILANEVLDAMPVQKFQLTAEAVMEYYVTTEQGQFIWQTRPTVDAELRQAVESLRPVLPLGYVSEINPTLPAWINSLADILDKGIALLIDYGFPRHEYYHPQRHEGTLICHYRHHAHSDPLILVGLQDITAHVDFTAVAESAVAAGWSVAGYTNQANFLLATGLMEELETYQADEKIYYAMTQAAKQLLLPSEMGELFKVIALSKQVDMPLKGFMLDQSGRL
ncbi:class I SAM-dependent methyltransferase [Beggiatoa leptomitoformis]|uniref:SAM-dependent methyltransferase n=1 Tax=Beggiatoa leptomitoformis TaxID=288004 RepID=A0A2N9YD82_9GAMM|nr:SAM-dependent methyltransferase [Beggiatoa leptomitoformis]ALG69171.1 SAM-dependent methyltransferase [Beggiatoa leptomitoformis]AUI68404.1 SAM-dependent methyltransferase [Beggiatoa leptomitoformis]